MQGFGRVLAVAVAIGMVSCMDTHAAGKPVQSVKWMENRPSGVTMVQSRLATLGGSKLARDPAKFTVHAVDLQAGEYTDSQTGKRMAYRYFLPPDLAPNAQVAPPSGWRWMPCATRQGQLI